MPFRLKILNVDQIKAILYICLLKGHTELFVFLYLHSNDLEDFYLNMELKDDRLFLRHVSFKKAIFISLDQLTV